MSAVASSRAAWNRRWPLRRTDRHQGEPARLCGLDKVHVEPPRLLGVAAEHQAILLIDQLGKQSVKVLAQRAAPKLWVKRTTRWSAADRLAASMTSRTATASQGSTGGGASPASAATTPA